jgi:hypothetical protein
MRELMAKQPTGTPFNGFHETMYPVLWVYLHKQVTVIRVGVESLYVRVTLSAHLGHYFLQPVLYLGSENITPVLGTPDNVVGTLPHHVTARMHSRWHVPIIYH